MNFSIGLPSFPRFLRPGVQLIYLLITWNTKMGNLFAENSTRGIILQKGRYKLPKFFPWLKKRLLLALIIDNGEFLKSPEVALRRRRVSSIVICNCRRHLPNERRWRGVKKWINMVAALFVLAAFSLGCQGMTSTQEKVKCPKCGAVFTIDEGLKNITPWVFNPFAG